MSQYDYLKQFYPGGRDTDGGRMFFPGTADGIPVKADSAPNLTDDEYARIPIIHTSHTKVFDLSQDDELAAYNGVVDMCAKGICKIRFEKVEYDPEAKNWRMLVQWFSMHGDPDKQEAR